MVREVGLLGKPLDVLHVAPDQGLDARMAGLSNLRYVSGDPDRARGPEQLDLTALRFGDGTFDLVIAYHVLEHIDDDVAALAEIRRILRPGATALLQVPTRAGETIEDPSVTTPQGRLDHFGQEDHVRIYGDDFPDRVRAAGLDCEPVVYRDQIDPADRERFGLLHRHGGDPLEDRLWTIVVATRPR